MSTERQAVKDQWEVIRARLRERWPQLSREDIQQIDGDSRKLIALIHQRTGEGLHDIEEAIDELAASSEGLLERVKRTASETVESSAEYVRGSYNYAREGITHRVEEQPGASLTVAFAGGALLGWLIGHSMARSVQQPRHWYDWH